MQSDVSRIATYKFARLHRAVDGSFRVGDEYERTKRETKQFMMRQRSRFCKSNPFGRAEGFLREKNGSRGFHLSAWNRGAAKSGILPRTCAQHSMLCPDGVL